MCYMSLPFYFLFMRLTDESHWCFSLWPRPRAPAWLYIAMTAEILESLCFSVTNIKPPWIKYNYGKSPVFFFPLRCLVYILFYIFLVNSFTEGSLLMVVCGENAFRAAGELLAAVLRVATGGKTAPGSDTFMVQVLFHSPQCCTSMFLQ